MKKLIFFLVCVLVLSINFSFSQNFQPNWFCLFPTKNTSGPVSADIGIVFSVWVNPQNTNIVFAGSNTGGIFKTTDGGQHWFPSDNGFQSVVGIDDIAGRPDNPNILYVATGMERWWNRDWGYGIYKTTDGGNTWAPTGLSFNPGTALHQVRIKKMAINADNPDNMLAISKDTLYKTLDGGLTWTKKEFPTGHWGDIEFEPVVYENGVERGNSKHVYIADNGFWVSRDGGETFIDKSDMLTNSSYFSARPDVNQSRKVYRAEVAVQRQHPEVVMVYYCTKVETYDVNGNITKLTEDPEKIVLKSNDYGLTFNKVDGNVNNGSIGGGPGYSCNQFEISPNDVDVLYIAGHWLAKYRIENNTLVDQRIPGGYNYPYHADQRDLQLIKNGNNDVVYLGNDGGLTKSVDGGLQWADISTNGLNIAQAHNLGLGDDFIRCGFFDNYFKKYSLSDSTFKPEPGSGDGGLNIVDYRDNSKSYLGVFGGSGHSFVSAYKNTSVEAVTKEKCINLYPMEIDPVDHLTVYIGAENVWKTVDGGKSWSKLQQIKNNPDHNSLRCIAVAPSNSRVVYASYELPVWKEIEEVPDNEMNKFYKTTDGGQSWEQIILPACRYNEISDITVSPYDENKLWVTFSEFELKDDIPSKRSSVHRVMFSADGGASFEDVSNNLPNIPVNCLAYYQDAGRDMDELYIGTDAGIYYTNATMNGNWQEFNNGLPKAIISDIKFDYKRNKIIASTFGRGVWASGLSCEKIEGKETVIRGNQTWTGECIARQDIKIRPGKTLSLNNCTLRMAGDTKIIVMQGAKLVVDGGKISGVCNRKWKGIEVWDASLGRRTNKKKQGLVELKNGAFIENAIVDIIKCKPQR